MTWWQVMLVWWLLGGVAGLAWALRRKRQGRL